MEGIKRCARCYQVISCIDSSDWYSHLSVKYCDSCREIVKKEQSAARVKAFRQRKRISDKEKDLKIKNLELEVEILRGKINSLLKI